MQEVIAAFLIILSTSPLFSDQKAETSDGRRVLLRDDGSWEWIVEEDTGSTDQFGTDEIVYGDATPADGSTVTDFRKTAWGMNRESIIAIEGEPDINEHKYLAYNRTIATFDCFAVFYLESDEVTVAAYIFTEEHTNRNLFLDDFESLNELLTRKYGAPTSDGTVWKNDLYKDDANDWGSAVAYGHLRFITSWETDRTRIMHVLSGDNYEISHAINYLSKEFEDLNRSADAETLDDL